MAADLCDKIVAYARDKPVKFVCLASFCVLAAVPLLGFLAYAVTAIISSIIGAAIFGIFFVSVGVVGLAFVLVCVACISMCATSIFGAIYVVFCAASCTLDKTKEFGSRLCEKQPTSSMPKWPDTKES